MDAEERFHEIISEAISKASEVSCPADVYRDGLRQMIEELRTEIVASEESAG